MEGLCYDTIAIFCNKYGSTLITGGTKKDVMWHGVYLGKQSKMKLERQAGVIPMAGLVS